MRWVERKDMIEGIGFEESGATIYFVENGTFDLYEIPQYGGTERFSGNYPDVESAKKEAESWT